MAVWFNKSLLECNLNFLVWYPYKVGPDALVRKNHAHKPCVAGIKEFFTQSVNHLQVSYVMELSADDVATAIFNDYGLLEGDSDDQGDDINGYLGAPVLKHSDLTADLGDTALRHDETMEDDVAVEDDGGMDYTIDDEASNRSIHGASDTDSSNKYSDFNNKVSSEQEIQSDEEGTSAACFVSTHEREIQSDEEGTSAARLVSTRSNEDIMLDMVSENDIINRCSIDLIVMNKCK